MQKLWRKQMFSSTKVRVLMCLNHAEIFDTFTFAFLLCYTGFLLKRWKLDFNL